MVFLRPVVHAMESKDLPPRHTPASEPSPPPPPTTDSPEGASSEGLAREQAAEKESPPSPLSAFEDFPLKNVPRGRTGAGSVHVSRNTPELAPASFASRAQSVFGSLGLPSAGPSGGVQAESSASPEAGEGALASEQSSWYVSESVAQRRRSSVSGASCASKPKSSVVIREVDMSDAEDSKDPSDVSDDRGMVLANREEREEDGEEEGKEEEEEVEREMARQGWRRRAAGDRDGGGFLREATVMSAKAERAQVAGMVGQDDTLDDEDEEDEFDRFAEGMALANDNEVVQVSRSGWAENFSEEIGQVKRILGRMGEADQPMERWRTGWRPEDQERIDRAGAERRLAEDRDDAQRVCLPSATAASALAPQALRLLESAPAEGSTISMEAQQASISMGESAAPPAEGGLASAGREVAAAEGDVDMDSASARAGTSDPGTSADVASSLANQLAEQGEKSGRGPALVGDFLGDLRDGGGVGGCVEGTGGRGQALRGKGGGRTSQPAPSGQPGDSGADRLHQADSTGPSLFSWPSRLDQPFLSTKLERRAGAPVQPPSQKPGLEATKPSLAPQTSSTSGSLMHVDNQGVGSSTSSTVLAELQHGMSSAEEGQRLEQGREGSKQVLGVKSILKKRSKWEKGGNGEVEGGGGSRGGDYQVVAKKGRKRVRFAVEDCPEGLEDKVSHLPPPLRATSQKASVPDHVENPHKYTCYEIDWSDMDGPDATSNTKREMTAYDSAVQDALSAAAAAAASVKSRDVVPSSSASNGSDAMEVEAPGAGAVPLPQVLPGNLGGSGKSGENRMMFVKRGMRGNQVSKPGETSEKAQADAGGEHNGKGSPKQRSTSLGIAASLMAEDEETEEDMG